MKIDIPALQANLRDFGLNPKEWILEIESHLGHLFELQIRSKKDHEVTFQGWAEHQAWLMVTYQG